MLQITTRTYTLAMAGGSSNFTGSITCEYYFYRTLYLVSLFKDIDTNGVVSMCGADGVLYILPDITFVCNAFRL